MFGQHINTRMWCDSNTVRVELLIWDLYMMGSDEHGHMIGTGYLTNMILPYGQCMWSTSSCDTTCDQHDIMIWTMVSGQHHYMIWAGNVINMSL